MLRRRVLIIFNPAAGRVRSTGRRLDRVVAALERRGCVVVVRRTGPASGDAERLAREAEADFDIIVAAGGDGTLNAVANGAVANRAVANRAVAYEAVADGAVADGAVAGGMRAVSRPLALLPLGTANVLAQEFGLPRRPELLAELIEGGRARPIWPGRVGNRLFLTMASSGFDAEIVAAVNPRIKRYAGRFAFAGALFVCLGRYRPFELCVRVDGVDHRATTVIAAKGRCYAGPYVIAPRADRAEPMLDLVLFRRSGRVMVLRYLGALLLGRLMQRSDVTFLRSCNALVSAADFVPVQADGEIVARLPVLIEIAAQPLQLVQPCGARGLVR